MAPVCGGPSLHSSCRPAVAPVRCGIIRRHKQPVEAIGAAVQATIEGKGYCVPSQSLVQAERSLAAEKERLQGLTCQSEPCLRACT